jgi:CheY-like chemotaxis protein
MPAMAGFEATREAESQFPDRVPANWRDLARQRDDERRRRMSPVEVEPLSSSFAGPSDHPTSPPGQFVTGRVSAILLVGGARLAGSSLIRELRGLGCQVDHVQDLSVALERLAGQAYDFAFLDDRSLKGRTRSVCRVLRRRARALRLNLTLVVLARDDGVLRRLLARWAGCDTWMTLPLDRDRLARFLQDGSRLRTGP